MQPFLTLQANKLCRICSFLYALSLYSRTRRSTKVIFYNYMPMWKIFRFFSFPPEKNKSRSRMTPAILF